MRFMNKKEEVLDIKLTQYGKKLLAEGKLDPVYYEFFDDNILYDVQYGGVSEIQNDIENRILYDTPQLRTQHKFTSASDKISDIYIKQPDGKVATIPITQVKENNTLVSSLGTSEVDNSKFPAFKLKIYDGEITSVNTDYTSSFGKRIPQINCKIEADVNIKSIDDLQHIQEFSTVMSPPDTNGNFLTVNVPTFLLELEEQNVEFSNENFEIEVFSFFTSSGDLMPLSFLTKEKNSNIINGILGDDIDENEDFRLPSNLNTEYYFDVVLDGDIQPVVFSNLSARFKSSGLYDNSAMGSYKKDTILEIADIYSTNVTDGDIEDCS